jgi:hypothetical protein
MSYEQPSRGRLARLFEAADRGRVPLRAILVTAGVVVAACLAGKLVYLLRDVVLLMLVAGFVAVLLSPVVARVQRRIPRRGPAVTVVALWAVLVLHRAGRGVRGAAGQRDHPSGGPAAGLRRQRAARHGLDRPPRGQVPRPEPGAAEHAQAGRLRPVAGQAGPGRRQGRGLGNHRAVHALRAGPAAAARGGRRCGTGRSAR